jgi:hypothetical protein
MQAPDRETMRAVALEVRRAFVGEARRAWPFYLVLGVGLGAVLYVGVNLSNSFPSEERPFGWPGPASFAAGVATLRRELVLATTLPAIGLGLHALWRRDPKREGLPVFGGVVLADAVGILLGILIAAWIGGNAASAWPSAPAYRTFVVAHALLALAAYSLAVLAKASTRGHGAAITLGLFVLFLAVFDAWLQWRLFRAAGYHRLTSGDLPSWYLAWQAASPLSSYRGTLILGFSGFRDYLESAALKGATLPEWATWRTFSAALLALWVTLPLGFAATVWKARALAWRRDASQAVHAPAAAPKVGPGMD